ncbi:ubiquinol oxidase 2, mitochondrial [Nicotiana attenuata]|uniref:Ubiquinol oxidase n=1 Tax=Nicotiana attenuata TaxID=49451 RepID=A0A1J6IKL7_NICAT|nr:ubiquinol oxidase 2, mitochondrial [Nicotiana attenuata]
MAPTKLKLVQVQFEFVFVFIFPCLNVCKLLRRSEQSGGWIEEAENEMMHLMTFMEAAKPNWYVPAIAIDSYIEFLKELDKGNIKNVPAPAIATDYKA